MSSPDQRISYKNWVRRLRSGQIVSYGELPISEVYALAFALDEWEMVLHKRGQLPSYEKHMAALYDERQALH